MQHKQQHCSLVFFRRVTDSHCKDRKLVTVCERSFPDSLQRENQYFECRRYDNDGHLARKEDVRPVLVRKNSRPNFFPRSIICLSRLMLTLAKLFPWQFLQNDDNNVKDDYNLSIKEDIKIGQVSLNTSDLHLAPVSLKCLKNLQIIIVSYHEENLTKVS